MILAELDPLVAAAAAAAREAGAILRRRPARVDRKGGAIDLVTELDLASEACVRRVLGERTPGVPVQGEEGGGVTTGLRWVVDPLDGTTNFVHGLPCYCTSVALMRGNDPLLGVVLEVTRNECFSAWKGGGAFLNGTPMRVSARTDLRDSLLATGFPYDDFGYVSEYMDLLRELMHRTRGIRRLGSAAADLAYVACGRFEAFYEYGLNSWDVAAGVLLVREAGGRVSGFHPAKDPVFDEEIVASNSAIHTELLEVIERNWQRQD